MEEQRIAVEQQPRPWTGEQLPEDTTAGQELIAEKSLHRMARVISALFTPFTIPFVAFLILFIFSYLRIMPLAYKLTVLGLVYVSTIMLPTLGIYLFQRLNKLTPAEMAERKRRYVPFLLTIVSYIACFLLMRRLHIPWYMTGIILAALLMMIISVVVNHWWKLSEHTEGAGAVVGGLVAFSALFGYNPVWWLCAIILVAGIVGTSRIILGHHTVGEVLGGFAIGWLCAMLVLNPMTNLLFRILII